ncbi:MAG: serine/threonine protein kinase [Myxococcales bacterium]|nr:serine/threonine protein kinase [Myxococcales bacterium]
MQERPASGEGQLSVCPYCDSTIVEGQAHDCSEMGENPTLSVEALPKVKAEEAQQEPAAVLPAMGAVAVQSAKAKTSSASIRKMPAQTGTPSSSAGASGDEIHGLIIDGRYEVLEKASQGGMGTVYKARHATLRNLLAVKILRRPKDEVSRRRFLQEAQLLSQIKHPNIVQVIDFGELPTGKSYLAMEFLSGPTLTAAVRDGQMTPLRACRIASQIARGMHHVHEQNIVHRDLKPDKISSVEKALENPLTRERSLGNDRAGSCLPFHSQTAP